MAFLTLVLGALAAAPTFASTIPRGVKSSASDCANPLSILHLPDPPHNNYLLSDCHSSAHVIVTSPAPGTHDQTKPRLLIAWPAGNSGALAMFAPEHSADVALDISLKNSSSNEQPLDAIYDAPSKQVGVSGTLNFNVSARLTVPILGSVRTLRDYTEGGSTNQDFQDSFGFEIGQDGSATINRTWFDAITTTWLGFTPLNGANAIILNKDAAWTLTFGAGTYQFNASFNYPQLEQLQPSEVLNNDSAALITQDPDQTTSLSFLSYTDKLLAGTWRFLTYFGRDSMISMLLMQPILNEGAIEAAIGAVLERINRTDGTACHEEVIGDYATWTNKQNGINSTAPSCDYKMIDTDFYLPIAMKNYFVDTTSGQQRSQAFFDKTASFLAANNGLKYSQLADLSAEKIMRIAAPFASSQVKENLLHLNDGQSVGQWRDSPAGLGGGRIPFDVNTALVPAGLRAIAALSRAGYFADHPDWKDVADSYAQIWEDATLQFFQLTVPQSNATSLISAYASSLSIPSNTSSITADMVFHGLALDGSSNRAIVPVMNTDDCFRHFFLNTTNQTQLSALLSQTADHILQPFPVGLSSDVGLFVSNPGYSGDATFDNTMASDDYHGTVVWSWQLAMMAAGLARQLDRCSPESSSSSSSSSSAPIPDFCNHATLHGKLVAAYNHLWDLIARNSDQLSHEVWSWHYDDGFKVTPLGELTSTESNIRQLWSLTFLAVRREDFGAAAGKRGLVFVQGGERK